MEPVERLAICEDIRQLMARRVRALDTRDWETYAACHAPDFVASGVFSPGDGRDAMMAGLMKVYAGIQSLHIAHSPEIEVISSTRARGYWQLADRLTWSEDGVDHWAHGWGYYECTYRVVDAAWVFASRTLTYLHRELSPGSQRMRG